MRRLAFLLPALLFAACVTTEADRQALQKGFNAYSNRRFDDALAAANRFIEANPASPNIDEAYYLRAITRMTRGPVRGDKDADPSTNRRAAAADLRAALEKSTRPDLKAKATRLLNRIEGDESFDASRWKEAREAYQRALAGSPPPPPVDDVYYCYRIGACFQAMGDWDAAGPWFRRVVAANADSYLTERSITRMNARNFALQFGAFQEGPRAAELINALRAGGITATVVTETREGKLLYLVRSGNYRTWQEADAARDAVMSKHPLVAIVP